MSGVSLPHRTRFAQRLPLPMPRYPVEPDWRTSALIGSTAFREAIKTLFKPPT